MPNSPKYSVIVPSYNGGSYLKECVQSVLAQTYADFELAVLEDASTDGSLEWLQSLSDPRLKLYPSPRNLGIAANWARALEIAKGQWMTILGHDDRLDPDYLQVMDDLVASQPEAALYFAHFRYIDAQGEVIRSCRALPARETADAYLAALFTGERDTYGTGYMIRSRDYHEVGGIPQFPKLLFADDALWMTLMHRSFKATAQKECFAVRSHAASVGAGARREWIAAMHPYISFLEKLGQNDAAFAAAYRGCAPAYFRGICCSVLIYALVSASKMGQRIDAEFENAVFAELARVSPAQARQLRRMKKVRLCTFINRYWITRQAYRMADSIRNRNR